jgi:hypothetical protein
MGEINPVGMATVDVIPKMIPEKFGELSIMLANTPVDTAPWNANEIVIKITDRLMLHPA